MKGIEVKYDSLRWFLITYMFKCFVAMFTSAALGRFLYSVFSAHVLDKDDLLLSLTFALAMSIILALFYGYKYRDVFNLLNNDVVETPDGLDCLEDVSVKRAHQFGDLVALLEMSGLRVSYLDYDKKIIKVRKKPSLLSLGSGAILYHDSALEEMSLILFSLDYNRKDRLNNFRDELLALIEG